MVDIHKAGIYYGERLPNNMIELFKTGRRGLEIIEKMSRNVEKDLELAIKFAMLLDSANLYVPVPKPPKIICIVSIIKTTLKSQIRLCQHTQ